MSKIKLISESANVAPIHWAILKHPELWNEHNARTKDESSPHYELDDIWPRFGDIEYAENNQPHDSKCCLLYTSPSPRDGLLSRMPSSA